MMLLKCMGEYNNSDFVSSPPLTALGTTPVLQQCCTSDGQTTWTDKLWENATWYHCTFSVHMINYYNRETRIIKIINRHFLVIIFIQKIIKCAKLSHYKLNFDHILTIFTQPVWQVALLNLKQKFFPLPRFVFIIYEVLQIKSVIYVRSRVFSNYSRAWICLTYQTLQMSLESAQAYQQHMEKQGKRFLT